MMQTGEPSLVPVAHADERFYSGVDDRTGFHTRMMLAVPIKVEGSTIGVIEVINPVAAVFDDDAQRLLLAVADLAAVAIRNAALYERVRQAERRYENLFNESSDPILVLDLEGKILDLNQRAVEVLKRPREQLIGADFCEASLFHWRELVQLPTDAISVALAGSESVDSRSWPLSSLAIQKV